MNNFSLFLELGFKHILEGYDHLLFLVGLIIVTKNFKELLGIVTAFTIAHSITLLLCAFELISFNPLLTETFIAASIAYVGIENIIMKRHNYRWLIAGAFGLVHGAGFSGHLTDLLKSMFGMGNIWGPIIGFNIGIEAGQILVVAFVFPLVIYLRNIEKYKIAASAVSILIAAAGIFLVVSRLWSI